MIYFVAMKNPRMRKIHAFAELEEEVSPTAPAVPLPDEAARQHRGSSGASAAMPDRTVISSPRLHRMQRQHFLLFDVLPAIGTIAAFAFLPFHPLGWLEVGLFLAMWLVTGLGLTVGFHRLFSHRAFAASNTVRVALIIAGSMAARGPMLSWVGMHRRHHQYADSHGDLHSPNLHGSTLQGQLRGIGHAHFTWMIKHDCPNAALYVPDLLGDPLVVWTNRHYYSWIALGLVLPAALGALLSGQLEGMLTGLLWGGLVRIFVVAQTMAVINSCLHAVGSRSFDAQPDNSRNCGLLSLVTWGEAWHNNHHAFPYSAAFGLGWYQLDPGFWLIRGLRAVGVVWNVKVAHPEKIAEKRNVSRHGRTLTG